VRDRVDTIRGLGELHFVDVIRGEHRITFGIPGLVVRILIGGKHGRSFRGAHRVDGTR
jgi:hypothetical protein